MDEGELDSRLMSAVRAGDAEAVRALLDEGAAPGKEPRLRLPEAARERLLTSARGWYETGAAEELRRRTGTPGPATTVRVQDSEYDHVDQVSLGGLVVRAGHGAILTSLEWAFRILTPVDELIARAVAQPDENHVNWSTVCWILTQRRSFETWSAVVAHRHHPAPAHRRFVMDFLRMRALLRTGSSDYEKKESDFLATWAAEETDSGTLAKVLDAFTEYGHPGQEAIGLRYAGHPDPRVRREVPYALFAHDVPHTPAARAALLTLTRDPDAEVRIRACTVGIRDDELLPEIIQALLLLTEDPDPGLRASAAGALAGSRDRTPAVANALAALLDEDDQLVRLEAAYGLALRNDPRTDEAIDRVGPLGAAFDHDHRADALWRWKRRKDNSTTG
ncbi:hypothetical protein T261_5712 [Streptomyces lydicus]|nr:hypothetical protein T261_5712 [Streptomyces lydicus]